MKVPARLLDELDWLLAMDTAASRSVVMALVERLAAAEGDMAVEYEVREVHVHDYLDVREVDAVQRLRGWNRLRYGTVTVEAEWLCDVRNLLDGFLLGAFGMDCEDYAKYSGDAPEERARAAEAADRGEMCDRCDRCQYLVMRDRLDDLLDSQGFVGDAYYRHYVAGTRDYDPEVVWRTRVLAVTGR